MPDFELDTSSLERKFTCPSILAHPHIPGDLAGVNPRMLLGDEWWDTVRKAAYAANGHHCWACGGKSKDDPYHPWLEAHECYQFDYKAKIMKFWGVVALCHSCHMFIHSGRMWAMYQAEAISKEKISRIVWSRMEILDENGLKPFIFTKAIQYMLGGDSEIQAMANAWTKDGCEWIRPTMRPPWRLEFMGMEIYSERDLLQYTTEELEVPNVDDVIRIPEGGIFYSSTFTHVSGG